MTTFQTIALIWIAGYITVYVLIRWDFIRENNEYTFIDRMVNLVISLMSWLALFAAGVIWVIGKLKKFKQADLHRQVKW